MTVPALADTGFRPAPWLRGRHLQTIVPALLPARSFAPHSDSILVDVGSGCRLKILASHPPGGSRGTLVLIHGLGGSADSVYLLRTGRMALERGWTVVRVNLRNCGGTEALATTLYNAGQSEDAGRILEELSRREFPRPFALLGFSLGGNLALRYAGMAGSACRADAVVGINPPVNLQASVDCLEEPRNALYQGYFIWRLSRLIRLIRKVRPVPGPPLRGAILRSLRRFDTAFTAPDGGFASAEEYYRVASAAPHLDSLQVPSLILSSQDDPFVPARTFKGIGSPPGTRLRFLLSDQGGHVGYWQSGRPRFWAGAAALDFLGQSLGA
jgi:predicted alpha/beta-fold hydrolase